MEFQHVRPDNSKKLAAGHTAGGVASLAVGCRRALSGT